MSVFCFALSCSASVHLFGGRERGGGRGLLKGAKLRERASSAEAQDAFVALLCK